MVPGWVRVRVLFERIFSTRERSGYASLMEDIGSLVIQS